MATIFFDTCAIRYLVKKGIKGSEVKSKLSDRKRVPVVGRNTLFECAKNYKNDPAGCIETYTFIEDLQPEYTATRNQLYVMEGLKLQKNIPVRPWCSSDEREMIKRSNSCLILGDFSGLEKHIADREENVRKAINTWCPDYRIEVIGDCSIIEAIDLYKLYICFDKHDSLLCAWRDKTGELKKVTLVRDGLEHYDEMVEKIKKRKKLTDLHEREVFDFLSKNGLSNCFTSKDASTLRYLSFEQRVSQMSDNDETINRLMLLFKVINLEFSREETYKFFHNQSDYPALRTLFRSILFLGDSPAVNVSLPSKDRITDAIQFTEAAYSVTFLSEENKLVGKKKKELYGKQLNPDIELLHVDVFFQDLCFVRKQ